MSERTSYAPGTPSWVDLVTTDLQDALRFYGGLLGWEMEDAGEEAGHYHQALLRGKRVAGIGPNPPGMPPLAAWTPYLSGTDADAHAAAIEDAGGQVVMGPLDVFEEGRMLLAMDPAGAMFGIWQAGRHAGSQLVNENAAPTWNELLTRDLDGAVRFYGAIFDYGFDELPESADYRLMTVNGRVVGGIWQLGDETSADTPSHWLSYFHLDDVDAGLARAEELGGQVVSEVRDSPYGRFARVRDPQGALFALIRGAIQE
jgi:predicted enzyme related to lactoylglutathione lyase